MASLANASRNIAVIDTNDAVGSLVDKLLQLPKDKPAIYINVQGINVSRTGTVSLLTLYIATPEREEFFLVDIHSLGGQLFIVRGSQNKSLKDVLESAEFPKVFFDVRKASDALYARYNIKLEGVEDVQLMENATRASGGASNVFNLALCMNRDSTKSTLHWTDSQIWRWENEYGDDLSSDMGNPDIINARPLPDKITAYCVAQVRVLPALYDVYSAKLSNLWKDRVICESSNRIADTQKAGYELNGRYSSLGPWTYEGDHDVPDFEDEFEGNDYEDFTFVENQGSPI